MVNSGNEGSPLKEVIVGSGFNYKMPGIDLSLKLFFFDNAFYHHKNRKGKIILKQKYIEELEEDVQNLVKTIENKGVKVHRPSTLNKIGKFKTPYGESEEVPALNVRDQAIVLGDTILETAPLVRCRYFENDYLKPVFYEKFMEGAKGLSMPRPMMTDHSFDLSYVENQGPEVTEDFSQVTSEFDVGLEMMIDAAQCIRFGEDILVNVSNRNHLLGFQGLERTFPQFRGHKIRSVADNHLDSYIVPLNENTLMLRNESIFNKLPDFLKDGKILYPPEPKDANFPDYDSDDVGLASKYIDMNVLSLNEKTVVINSLYPELIELLEKEGFNCLPVRHRHRGLFNGGFHCFTLDLVRSE